MRVVLLCLLFIYSCGDDLSSTHESGSWVEPDYCEYHDLDNRCFGGDVSQQCYWSALYYDRGNGLELIDDEYVCDRQNSSGKGFCIKEFKEYCFWNTEGSLEDRR